MKKILIDIGHPAHVHYFKNFIKIMECRGHEFLLTARDKEVTHKLLNSYKINFTTRGTGKKGIIGKAAYLIYGTKPLYYLAQKFKPDLFLSVASPYAAM